MNTTFIPSLNCNINTINSSAIEDISTRGNFTKYLGLSTICPKCDSTDFYADLHSIEQIDLTPFYSCILKCSACGYEKLFQYHPDVCAYLNDETGLATAMENARWA